jgi:hypothetical protein
VLEHRAVLGGVAGSLAVIQAGSPDTEDLINVVVVDGAATALQFASGTTVSDQALRLAEEAARALSADLVAIIIALGSSQPVVWDAQPVPDFRDAIPIAGVSVAQAIAHAVERRLATAIPGLPPEPDPAWAAIANRAQLQGQEQGLQRDLVISA